MTSDPYRRRRLMRRATASLAPAWRPRKIPAAFLEIIALPLASGAAEFRHMARLASEGRVAELLADLA